ncbi:DUF3379 family protein [Paraferrimonas haliotis]|uniref:DUF3379 domain-containing protein n=1 Tax=Paraferrimonas haliotis TaxID=2013866 RepID=A0AA37TMW1_9GAMM|nr:DUF3379 family protein [Paraferrimonas haliotis]GLS82628.1 hypothetical protein GCM10007894_06050 [Paraferrimonas haliotis]
MDELKFRREAYSDPNSKQADFQETVAANPDRKAFVEDLQQLDHQISEAFAIPVDDNLADKLLLNQKLHSHKAQRRKIATWVSMAASIAFVAGLTLNVMRTAPIDLSQQAIAHVMHERSALSKTSPIEPNQLQVQLARYGEATHAPLDGVVYAKECDFQGVKSLHWIVQTESGPVTVFIVPKNDRLLQQAQFNEAEFKGLTIEQQRNLLVIVGENSHAIDTVKQQVDTNLYSI